jgi:GT2 family glycosyltransferase
MEPEDFSARQISVIVLGHNRFYETTDRCLASLAQDADFQSWDVLVVDNGSDAENRDAAKRAAGRFPGLRLICSERNAGFAGGMNIGLEQARGDPIVLVTSDVLVPPGTIRRLADSFEARPSAGLVGPVTNTAGNEQCIFVEPGLAPAEILRQGLAFADAGPDRCYAAHRLDFCCVGLRRRVYETLGGLDQAFNRGYYEDFDYSLRARQAGFEVLIAENAFVYHEGGGSFGRASKENRALIARNKKYLIRKHGRDTLLPHVRDGNLSILEQYAERAARGAPPPPIRLENRLKFAATQFPRSFFKRWKYRYRVAALRERLASFLPPEARRY